MVSFYNLIYFTTEQIPENPESTTVEDAITEVNRHIPADIRARYCVGDNWDELLRCHNRQLDEISLNMGTSFRMLMAACLINVAAESLMDECEMMQKVDPETRELVQLSPEEAISTLHAGVPALVTFVTHVLGVPVYAHPENSRPFVYINEEAWQSSSGVEELTIGDFEDGARDLYLRATTGPKIDRPMACRTFTKLVIDKIMVSGYDKTMIDDVIVCIERIIPSDISEETRRSFWTEIYEHLEWGRNEPLDFLKDLN